MLLKECGICKNLIPYGRTYCDRCTPIAEERRREYLERSRKASNKRYNSKRDPKYVRFYNSSEWRILSRKRLQDDGYKCVKCGAIASEVDHIKAIQTPEGWELRLAYTNTQSLCIECHNKKHNRFIKRERPTGV